MTPADRFHTKGSLQTKGSRTLSALAFLSTWAAAAAVPGLRFSSGGPGTALPGSNAALIARDVTLALGAVLFLAGLLIVAFIVRSILDLRRRKEDDQPEIVREKPRVTWKGYALLILATFSLVLVARWALGVQSGGESVVAGAAQSMPPQPSIVQQRSDRTLSASEPAIATRDINIPKWVLLAGLGVSAAGVLIIVWRGVLSRRDGRPSVARDIEEIARAAGERISQGADLSDSVIACYRNMCAVLAERMKIRAEMTPREFAERLSETGFPIRHVAALTGLFERVRYGHERLGEHERAQAREALDSVRLQAREDTG